MSRNIIRISQAPPSPGPDTGATPPPPPAPAPDLSGGLSLGAPPIGAPPMVAPPIGGVGPGSPTAPKFSLYPLESSGMILMDAEVEKRLKEQFASTHHINTTSEQEIANEIWKEYGGNDLGGVDQEKVGKRIRDKEVDLDEIKRTRDTKWERLPLGKNLDDLGITLQDITEMIIALSQGFAALKKKEAPGGAGGGMGMASLKYKSFIKIAKKLDKYGFYELADKLI